MGRYKQMITIPLEIKKDAILTQIKRLRTVKYLNLKVLSYKTDEFPY